MLSRNGLSILIGMFLCFGHLTSSADSMEFYVDQSRETVLADNVMRGGVREIFASGEITEGTAVAFWQFVSEMGINDARVTFNSPGGSLYEGLLLGRAIRQLGFSTSIGPREPNNNSPGQCASACAYAYAGGTARFFPNYSASRLGLHQFYSPDENSISSETAQQISGQLVSYLIEMGINAEAFSLATEAGPDGMIWLDPQQVLALQFATNGKSLPVAEIRLDGMRPYLRIEQVMHDVMTRVLLECSNETLTMHYGIVTTPDLSAMHQAFAARSYLELDYQTAWIVEGSSGVLANGSVLWITRTLKPQDVNRILNTKTLDGWVDGQGAMRFGTTLDILSVQNDVFDYSRRCFHS
jgi:hypothetical protein